MLTRLLSPPPQIEPVVLKLRTPALRCLERVYEEIKMVLRLVLDSTAVTGLSSPEIRPPY